MSVTWDSGRSPAPATSSEPAASRSRARRLPRKPAPPVITTFATASPSWAGGVEYSAILGSGGRRARIPGGGSAVPRPQGGARPHESGGHDGRGEGARVVGDMRPDAAEVFAGLPPARPDDESLRDSIRAVRAAGDLLLGVLDDDPTGSQAVHDVQVVTVLEEDAYARRAGRAGRDLLRADQLPQPGRAGRCRDHHPGRPRPDHRGRAARHPHPADQPERLDASRARDGGGGRPAGGPPGHGRPRLRWRAPGARVPGGRPGDRGRHPLGRGPAGLVPVGETEFAQGQCVRVRRVGPDGFRCGKKRGDDPAGRGAQHQPGGYPARRPGPGPRGAGRRGGRGVGGGQRHRVLRPGDGGPRRAGGRA